MLWFTNTFHTKIILENLTANAYFLEILNFLEVVCPQIFFCISPNIYWLDFQVLVAPNYFFPNMLVGFPSCIAPNYLSIFPQIYIDWIPYFARLAGRWSWVGAGSPDVRRQWVDTPDWLSVTICLLVANQVRFEMKYGVSNNGLFRGEGVTPVCPAPPPPPPDSDVLGQYQTNAFEISILLNSWCFLVL